MKRGNWAVIEQASCTDEKLISTWATYDDAWCAMQEIYTPEERDELHVDIMHWDEEQGDWTTEY